ncbi:MAG: UDP-N-acetylmuramoyl-L-alanine--D-glutamate ligase [Candidatus Moranbacteria bacterium]|nr:UDP-N-acetylmuramoyl-L-alanine--D-glutamate ligase [Candidatus Moranbacteria bacterium]
MYKGKKTTIMGLGLQGSGVAMAEFLAKKGAELIITDIKTKDKLSSAINKLEKFKNIKFVLGQHRPEDFSRTNLIIKGPGVDWNSQYLAIAKKHNVPIETEAGIFIQLVKNPIIGVTGTRGKSTTTHLIYDILKQSSLKAVIGGNIKEKPLISLLGKVKRKDTFMVLELSSFQLEGLKKHKKSPKIAVITNLMKDHLNRYRDLEHYHKSKETIVRFQKKDDFAVLNYDDLKVRRLASTVKSKVWFFSQDKLKRSNTVFLYKKNVYVRYHKKLIKLFNIDNLKLIGNHRLPNVLAAVAVAKILKLPNRVIKNAVLNFYGIEHRLEIVREVKGITFVNDTCATVPEATMMAIDSFKSVILIAGGADKKLSFADLAQKIIKRVKKLILLPGKGSDRLIIALKKLDPDFEYKKVKNINEAVETSREFFQRGDVVLLSPACSSFNLFNNEFERGDIFKKAVRDLEF